MSTNQDAVGTAKPVDFNLYKAAAGVSLAVLMVFFLAWVKGPLWGPYAVALSDADASAVGSFILAVIVGLPVTFLYWPCRAKARICLLVTSSALMPALLVLYGIHLNTIVHRQGMEVSLQAIAVSKGFESSVEIPHNVRDALLVSYQMAEANQSPWAPLAWSEIAWPAVPSSKEIVLAP